MKLTKLIPFGAAGVVAAGIFVAPTVVPTSSILAPQSAEASTHDAVVKNHKSSAADLEICKHWVGYGGVTCGYDEGVWYLDQGKNSKTGSGSPHWKDTDGYRIPYGYWAKVGSKRIYTAGWHKLRGCAGCTYTIRLYKNK